MNCSKYFIIIAIILIAPIDFANHITEFEAFGSDVLTGTPSPDTICPNSHQSIEEIRQSGCLPGNDWSSLLGHNSGFTSQMQIGASNPEQIN